MSHLQSVGKYCLVKVYEENSVAQILNWTGEEYFINSLSDNFGYSLLLHQNSTSGSFFKVSYSVESESRSLNFAYSVTLKFIGLSALRMDLSLMYYFITLYVLVQWAIQTFQMLNSYTISKITFICEKSLNSGKLQSRISDITFLKFSFLLESVDFYHW